MKLLQSVALLASVVPVLGSDYQVKERHFVPRGWNAIGSAPEDHRIELHFALKQGRFEELEQSLYEVSTPGNPRYRQHLTQEEVNDLVKPTDATLYLVEEWLDSHGVDAAELDYNPSKDWFTVTLPVDTIERLLQTKYSVYEHEDGTQLVRTSKWSLPAHLHEHIETIQPTTSFFRPRQDGKQFRIADELESFALNSLNELQVENPTVDSVCNKSAVTPLCLRTLYGTIDYTPQVPGKNKIGINNFLNETANHSDVNIFISQYRPDAKGFNFTTFIIDHGDDQQTPNTPQQLEAGKDMEANLDAETIVGLSYPTKLYTYNTGGSPPFKPSAGEPTDSNEPYATWLKFVSSQSDAVLPQTISTSYGDDEQTVPYSYAKSVCRQFAVLGARGVTLLFASGDSGVGTAGYCTSNDGKNRTEFTPGFPGSCPYVTTVGGAMDFNPEVVAYNPRNGYVSGGGFSNYFPRPPYQEKAVGEYVKGLGNLHKGLYNKKGRGFPDLAAQGRAFAVVWNGTVIGLDGTSAATPAAAGVITLVNDALIAAGKRPLGFLNPWLYSEAYTTFNDITNGSSLGCNTSGFPAKEGWDAVTGFGTFNFPKLKDLALEK
ncbi:peptidase S8/S53 domain-containing protein [Talaromyces proteolyticus]|uniref:tripeptidyl-peptidase II n=1 Tax=Talaromyces proteolyticus TaxID=1131652 RepID=A0AAD4Q0W8_9EURO|nr:peptidase S8/S53 domain-containing protein [Talaromyces proteolyticus]KAH8704965.1 peptidase S8/S53 domain-containing protein [Talaromyces proteolyticus]